MDFACWGFLGISLGSGGYLIYMLASVLADISLAPLIDHGITSLAAGRCAIALAKRCLFFVEGGMGELLIEMIVFYKVLIV